MSYQLFAKPQFNILLDILLKKLLALNRRNRIFSFFNFRVLSIATILLQMSNSMASLQLPKQLTKADRVRALEILGPSGAPKILGNPYTLGGYSGVELGYTLEVIPTSEISTLGGKAKSQTETSISNITIGKGLYHNIDLLMQLSPFAQSEDFSSVGGALRWGFYESDILPAHLSLVIHGSYTNIQNLISIANQGADLVMGFTVKDLTVYTGLGYLLSQGKFLGGQNSLNSEGSTVTEGSVSMWRGETISEAISSTHYLVGANLRFEQMFLALEMDRYYQTVFSTKIGIRF